jgi:CheY-like chemotaxis protein
LLPVFFCLYLAVPVKICSILLVDDDPDDRFFFEEALSWADPSITLHSASDGVEALDVCKTESFKPDLIFMDVNMPRMNGINCLAARKAIEKYADTPVIMYSTSNYYKEECFKVGAADYIEKPSDFKILSNLLKNITLKGLPL